MHCCLLLLIHKALSVCVVCACVVWCPVHVSLLVCLYDRLADKKVAIGYTYEDSTGGIGVDSVDDDASSDEDIDLGQSLVSVHSHLQLTSYYKLSE